MRWPGGQSLSVWSPPIRRSTSGPRTACSDPVKTSQSLIHKSNVTDKDLQIQIDEDGQGAAGNGKVFVSRACGSQQTFHQHPRSGQSFSDLFQFRHGKWACSYYESEACLIDFL